MTRTISAWDGRTLRRLRDAAGLSRRQLMFRFKAFRPKAPHERTIQRWEDSDTAPDADDLLVLAAILECDVQDFFAPASKGAAA